MTAAHALLTTKQRVMTPSMCRAESMLSQLGRAAAQFDSINLTEMQNAALLDRVDTKYLFGVSQLAAVLPALEDDYRVLDIAGVRLNHYQTLYFDTRDFAIYRQHHNGLGSRYKVRARKYVDSAVSFFEIKHKTNQNRTIKSRVQIPHLAGQIDTYTHDFVTAHTPFDADALELKLWNTYIRITLVSKRRVERVTLDVNVEFGQGTAHRAMPGLAIAEVKQDRWTPESAFVQHMRRLSVRPMSFSKYCAGIYMLYEGVKTNNFKPQIRQLGKVMQQEESTRERVR